MKKNQRIFMYNDQASFKAYKKFEDACMEAIDGLTEVAETSIKVGCVTDYKAFLEEPLEYLAETYWNTWGKDYHPPIADRMDVYLTSSKVSLNKLETLIAKYKSNAQSLGDKAPLLGDKVARQLTIDMFAVYVAENKEAEYKATQSLIKAVKKYTQVCGSNENYHISRFTLHNVDTDLEPKYYNFK